MSELAPGEPRKTYVYAIGGADRRLVKIGYSNDPQRRLNFIQVTCPFIVSILWMKEGGLPLEAALHRRFADRRVRGEWFEFPDGDAVELISGRAADAARRAADPPAPYAASCVEAPEDIAKALGVPVGSYVLREQRVISEDGEPVEVVVSWVPEGRTVGCDITVLRDGTPVMEDSARWETLVASVPGTGRPYRRMR